MGGQGAGKRNLSISIRKELWTEVETCAKLRGLKVASFARRIIEQWELDGKANEIVGAGIRHSKKPKKGT